MSSPLSHRVFSLQYPLHNLSLLRDWVSATLSGSQKAGGNSGVGSLSSLLRWDPVVCLWILVLDGRLLPLRATTSLPELLPRAIFSCRARQLCASCPVRGSIRPVRHRRLPQTRKPRMAVNGRQCHISVEKGLASSHVPWGGVKC